MKYLLADILVYDNEDGSMTLHNAADSESQALTCTAQTILNMLIAHHGMVVEREMFLQQVWDDRGLRGSSNSLNQYISILRKMLAALAPDKMFIVTVPKVGFMLSADITVVPLTVPASSAQLPIAIEPPGSTTSTTLSTATKSNARQNINWVYSIITLIVIGICIATLIWKKHSQQTELYLLDNIDTCPVYTRDPLNDIFKEQAKSLVRQMKDDGAFSCIPHSIFYAHIQDRVFYGDTGRVALTQCSQFQGKASACQTLFVYEW